MKLSARDLIRIPESRFAELGAEELIRVLAMGRDSDREEDKRRTRSAIRALLALEFDRVRGLVVTFRFPGHQDVQISAEDWDDATQEAFERVLAMLESFRGETVGQYRKALRTTVVNACMDFCRRVLSREKRVGGSLDETLAIEDGEGVGRYDRLLAKIAEIVESNRAAARDELEAVAGALEQIPNENMREVLRLTWAGHSSLEIAGQLGLTRDNVDQLRSRGTRRLVELLNEEDQDDD